MLVSDYFMMIVVLLNSQIMLSALNQLLNVRKRMGAISSSIPSNPVHGRGIRGV
jgi:hypothetical protein